MTLGVARKSKSTATDKDHGSTKSRGPQASKTGVPPFVKAATPTDDAPAAEETAERKETAGPAGSAGDAAAATQDATPDPASAAQPVPPPPAPAEGTAPAQQPAGKTIQERIEVKSAADHGDGKSGHGKPAAAHGKPHGAKAMRDAAKPHAAEAKSPEKKRERVAPKAEVPLAPESDEPAQSEAEASDAEPEPAATGSAETEPPPDIAAADAKADEAHDPQVAQARLDTVITEMQGRGLRSRDSVEVARDEATELLERRSEEARDRVRADARRTSRVIGDLFSAEKRLWTKTFDGADATINVMSLLQQAMTWLAGISAIAGVSNLVSAARDTVENTVKTSIDRVDQIKTKHQDKVHERTTTLAGNARTLGQTKADSYHDGDLGLRHKKQNAVTDMGEKFAKEAETREPEGKKSIADGVAKMPDDLRKEGDKVKADLQDPTPQLGPAVIGGAKATVKGLDDQSAAARVALRDAGKEAVATLDAGEREAQKGVKKIRTVADAQIRKTFRRGRKALRKSSTRLLEELDGVLSDATAKLREPSLPNIARARGFATWLAGKIERNAQRFVEALPTAVDLLAEPLFEIAAAAHRQFELARAQTITTLDQQRSTMQSRLESTLGEVDKMFAAIVKVFTDVLDDTKKEVKSKLDAATTDLSTRFDDALTKLDKQIEKSVKDAYDAAEAKLPDLGKQMDKAVDKIDWDDRHPILSTLRDIGGFVLGLVVSVIKWAFKLIIGLIVLIVLVVLLVVLLPIELATAIFIVAVLAVAALVGTIAYATYQRHEEAKKKGIDRGFFANLGLGFCDTVGFTKMYIAVTADDLTPYQRGEMFGSGVTDLIDVALVFEGVRGSIKGLKLSEPIPAAEANLGEFRGFAKVFRALNIEPGEMPRIERAKAIFEGTKEGIGDLYAKLRGRDTKIDEPGGGKNDPVRNDEQQQNEQQRNDQEQRERQEREEREEREQREQQEREEQQRREREQQERQQQEEQQRREQEQRERQQQEEQQRHEQEQRERQQREEQERREQEQRERAERERQEQEQRERQQREEQERRDQEQRDRQQREEQQRRDEEQRRERDERERRQRENRDQQPQDQDRPDAPSKAARDEAQKIWDKVFDGKQHGRDMFRAARDELANAKSLSPKEKADLFEAIAKEINRRDPSWQANRSEAVDANGKPLAGFFTGEARPFGFAIDAEGNVFQTGNIMESLIGVDKQGRMIFDMAKWQPITPTVPTGGGGGGPTGGGGAPGAEIKIEGKGQRPTVDWKPNADGRKLTIDGAVELARQHGVEIPDDIRFVVARDGYLDADTFAEYMSRNFNTGDRVSWEDFLNIHEEVSVKVRADVLASDEASVAVIAHEMHELNGLRAIFDARETIPAEELARLVGVGRKGNLHDQAWTIADEIVMKMRGEGKAKAGPPPDAPPAQAPPETPAAAAPKGPVKVEGSASARYTREMMPAQNGNAVEVATEGGAIVPTGKVELYSRGKSQPFTEDLANELAELQKQKQADRKAFDAAGLEERLEALKTLRKNAQRSGEMAKTLEQAGIADTPENNQALIEHLLDVGKQITEANRVDFPSEFEGPNGKIKILSTWKLLPDGRRYLATIKLIPIGNK